MGIKFTLDHFTPGRLANYLNATVVKKIQIATESRTQVLKKYFTQLINYLTRNDAIMLDTNGSVLSWNKTCEKLHGYKEHEILGQNINIFFMPLDRQLHLPEGVITSAKLKGKVIHHGKWVRKDGATFYGSMHIIPVKGLKNEVIGYMEFVREVKEQDTE